MYPTPSTTLALLLALPLALAQTYGSPGHMSVSSFNKAAGPGTCKHVDLQGKSAIRLPKEWMNGTKNCGQNVTVYYTPRFDGGGLAEPPVLTQGFGVVADVCAECKSWEAKVDAGLFDGIFPGGSEATWGPAFVLGE